ncbi:MAG: type IV secretory system conjugative DNA transfer family protein [Alphaproteobacteria bacterium]
MSDQVRDRNDIRIAPALVAGVIAYFVFQYFGPPLYGALINTPSAAAALLLFAGIAALVSDVFWKLGNWYDLKSATTASGNKGTAGFVQSLDEIRHDLLPDDEWGPYWGAFNGEEVMAPVGSNSLILGTTGSGKGVGSVQPNIKSIKGSKLVSDFKSENACITARALRERGETVRILNLGDINTDILGESDHYNPLVLIADSYWANGGLMDISDDVHELGIRLVQEPIGGLSQDGNEYFRNGSRGLIGFATQICVLIKGHNATLGDVAAMLNDKTNLLKHAQWACGRLAQSNDDETVQ